MINKYLRDLIFVTVFISFLWLIKVDFSNWIVRICVILPCLAIVIAGAIRAHKEHKK